MAMDSEYPPLPSNEAITTSLRHFAISDGGGAANSSISGPRPVPKSVVESINGSGPSGSQPTARVIVNSGDIFLDYDSPTGTSGHASYRWRVDSESLMQSSPYFRALLDPNKFSEGRHLMKQRELYSHDLDSWKNIDTSNHTHVQDYALPSVRLPKAHLSYCSGLDTIELFLRILSYHSFNDEEQENFNAEIRGQRPSSIARLIELADAYNSTQAVHDTLKRCNYTLGRPKLPLTKFNSLVLKMNEERIRQSIFIASFVNERTIFQILTHALIVSGSKFWASGIESPDPDTPKWQYLPDGLEGIPIYYPSCTTAH
jgi:hypothetical protein